MPLAFSGGLLILHVSLVTFPTLLSEVIYSTFITRTIPPEQPRVKCPTQGHNGDTLHGLIDIKGVCNFSVTGPDITQIKKNK